MITREQIPTVLDHPVFGTDWDAAWQQANLGSVRQHAPAFRAGAVVASLSGT